MALWWCASVLTWRAGEIPVSMPLFWCASVLTWRRRVAVLTVDSCVSHLCLQPLQIKSVVAPEHVKGYIYVEAYKQTHVKQAIEGVGNLRLGYWNQQMVPIKEMTDVLKVVKEVANLKPKSWVRLKRGIYKDDIAQVGGDGAAAWARLLYTALFSSTSLSKSQEQPSLRVGKQGEGLALGTQEVDAGC